METRGCLGVIWLAQYDIQVPMPGLAVYSDDKVISIQSGKDISRSNQSKTGLWSAGSIEQAATLVLTDLDTELVVQDFLQLHAVCNDSSLFSGFGDDPKFVVT